MKFRLSVDVQLEAENQSEALAKVAQHFTRQANGHHVDSLGIGTVEFKAIEEVPAPDA